MEDCFRCAAGREMVGVVKVTSAGTTVDMGPPLGRGIYDRDAIIVDYFLGMAAKFADAPTLDAVQEIVGLRSYQGETRFLEVLLFQA